MIRSFLLLLLFFYPITYAQSRIASLNLCMDQILLSWISPQNIASVTWLSGQKHYRKAPIPEHVYLNRGQAEELLPLTPDLVLVGQYGAQRAATRLLELGFNVVTIPDAYSLQQLQQQLSALENVLGKNPQLTAQQHKLQKLLTPEIAEPTATALILSANNITYGDGMLEHQLLTRAGYINLAAQQGVHQLARVTLEQVVDAQPDLLVLYGGEQDFALAHLAARHPVLKSYIESGRVFTLPAELSFCPALVAADVLQQLIEKRTEMRKTLVGKK